MLIATDLDGTLVRNDETEPRPYTARVLRRLDEAGIPVVFVTARPLRWMTGFWSHVGRHGLAVVSNGAITFDARTQTILDIAGIGPSDGLDLARTITAALPGAHFAIECADGMRLDPDYVEAYPGADAVRGRLARVWDRPAVKLLVRHPSAPADVLHSVVEDAVGARATVTWSTPGLVEISATGVTKASALQRLCIRLGVPRESVVAFGDMPNDIPMLAWAGIAYAVANAHESVRSAADRMAPSCDDEGVAQILESFLT